MNLFLRSSAFLLLLLIGLASCRTTSTESENALVSNTAAVAADSTVIYLVRHAEKETADPGNQDPDLTAAGKERAEALKALMQGKDIQALYATKYVRTKSTLKPLAEERNMTVLQYEAHDFNALREQVLSNHAGETVVVAGHSNTLLPLIEAFGGKRPVPDISDNQYNYIFRIAVAADKGVDVKTAHYGASTN